MKQFKKFKTIVVLAASLLLMLALFSVAYAQGHTTDQLEAAGWNYVNAGPNNWLHCFPPGQGNAKTLQVKVFGVSGDPFLGTEILIHQDVYAGQPCATDGGEPYHDLSGDGLP